MSTQIKFKIGDEVRVTKCGPDGKNDFSGDPVGMIGKVVRFSGSTWPYKLELQDKNPELYYPDYFAEYELELVSTPSPSLADAVLTIAARQEREAKRLFDRADSGELPGEFMHRARSRAEALKKIAVDLREAVETSR